MMVSVTDTNNTRLKVDLVKVNERHALDLLKFGWVTSGYISNRIRRRVEVAGRFICFGYGHRQIHCTAPDSIKCGEKVHIH